MEHGEIKSGSYGKFALMMATSFVIMYAVMFFNVAEFNHIYLSVMRFYMTILMVAPMAIVMLLFMKGMYKNKKVNIGILAGSVLLFILTFMFMRTQTFIGDTQYMRGMIPHHSSAILTSNNADIQDREVKKLAEDIIKAQEREIALMKQYLERLNR
ncbi:MAG: DUF305 domain-containing protein [Acidobacteriota bacterium]|nr:DUF305 domain-containing protein [Acidobacteriota bacterium]